MPELCRANYIRLNSALEYITPKDALAGNQQEIQAERDRKLEAARKQRQIRRQQAAEERRSRSPTARATNGVDYFRVAQVCSTDLWFAAPSVRYFCVIEQLVELGVVQPLPIYDNRIDLVHIRDVVKRGSK